jgi:hypothetical protein
VVSLTQFRIDWSGLQWRKASYSSGGGNECVEVASARHLIAMRDSKNPDGEAIVVSRKQWGTFTARVKSGHHDL